MLHSTLSFKKSKNYFALVDCNNFFVSCERLFEPSLKNKAVVVLSNNDGCIISRSNEAKALGIPMGAPYYQYEHLFKKHGVKVFSSHFALYADLSARVLEVLKTFPFRYEVYSVDEVFLFFSADQVSSLKNLAESLKTKIQKWIGLPVSVGVGRSKTLAKLASDRAKKIESGILCLENEVEEEACLKETPIREIWGIGKNKEEELKQHCIHTAYDFKYASEAWVRKKWSVVTLRTQLEIKGYSCLDIQDLEEAHQSLMCSRSFRRAVTLKSELAEALSSYVSIACERLRAEDLQAQSIEVFITSSKHHQKIFFASNRIILNSASSYTPDFIKAAQEALEKIFQDGIRYKKAGVLLLGLQKNMQQDFSFFSNPEENEKRKKLMRCIDSINQQQKMPPLQWASSGLEKDWKVKSNLKSKRFTADWNELKEVK